MRLNHILMGLFISAIALMSCSPKHSEIVVAEFGDYEIQMAEFENAYAKNAGGIEKAKEDSLSEIKNFLELYVNFKMKLRNADVRGYEKHPLVQEELESYKKSVGTSYLIEKMIVDPGLKRMYEQKKYELRVSHIMLGADAAGSDDNRKLAESLIKRLNEGEDFAKLAAEYSTDKFSKDTGGDIYYFTAGQIIPEFESAAYNTPVGTVYPEPVQTKYGYHIVKVLEKHERRYQLRARHILIDFKNEKDEIDSINARSSIEDIRNQILNGEDFGDMAKIYSEDKFSGAKGGDLGFFERRRMVQPFDEAVFNLKVGEISDIVKTQYGYHIIQLVEEKPYPTFKEELDNLRKVYEKVRFPYDKLEYVNNLKKEYNYEDHPEILDKIIELKDTIRFGTSYFSSPLRSALKDSVIFSFDGRKVICDSLFSFTGRDKEYNSIPITKDLLKSAIEKYSGELLIQRKAATLDKIDPEFAYLMEDYRDGLYIFRIQENEVWNKIKIDSLKIRELYEKTKDNYKYPVQVDFSEIYSRSDSLINVYYKMLREGADFDSLAAKYTERAGFQSKSGRHGMMDWDKNELSKLAENIDYVGSVSQPQQVTRGWSILKLNNIQPARIKTFEEAKAEVTSIFQDAESKRLEKEYLDKLNNLYHPVIYYDRVNETFKEEDN